MSKVLTFASRLSKLSIVIGAIMFIWLIGVSVSLYHQRQAIMAERERVHDAVTSTSCKKVPDTVQDGRIISGKVSASCLLHLGNDKESRLEEDIGRYLMIFT